MKEITIEISKAEVLAEVARRAYTLGQVATDDERLRWLLQGVADRGKKDIIANALLDGWEVVMQAMSPYVDSENAEGETMTILAIVPDNCRGDLARASKRHIRRVLEFSCLSAWKNVMNQDAGVELAKMSESAWNLKVLMNTREGVQKIRS